MSVASAGKTAPMAVTSVSFPLNISLAVENLEETVSDRRYRV